MRTQGHCVARCSSSGSPPRVWGKVRGNVGFIRHITTIQLAQYFHLPLARAAKAMEVSDTMLKRACRRLGIAAWPYKVLSRLSQQAKQAFSGGSSKEAVALDAYRRDIIRGLVRASVGVVDYASRSERKRRKSSHQQKCQTATAAVAPAPHLPAITNIKAAATLYSVTKATSGVTAEATAPTIISTHTLTVSRLVKETVAPPACAHIMTPVVPRLLRETVAPPARANTKTPARANTKTPARANTKTPARANTKTPSMTTVVGIAAGTAVAVAPPVNAASIACYVATSRKTLSPLTESALQCNPMAAPPLMPVCDTDGSASFSDADDVLGDVEWCAALDDWDAPW
jgi:hypothetical protein